MAKLRHIHDELGDVAVDGLGHLFLTPSVSVHMLLSTMLFLSTVLTFSATFERGAENAHERTGKHTSFAPRLICFSAWHSLTRSNSLMASSGSARGFRVKYCASHAMVSG
eukprot:1302529-Rhodomonas_salina.1